MCAKRYRGTDVAWVHAKVPNEHDKLTIRDPKTAWSIANTQQQRVVQRCTLGLDCPATVHHIGRAGHHGRVLRSQEDDHLGNLRDKKAASSAQELRRRRARLGNPCAQPDKSEGGVVDVARCEKEVQPTERTSERTRVKLPRCSNAVYYRT